MADHYPVFFDLVIPKPNLAKTSGYHWKDKGFWSSTLRTAISSSINSWFIFIRTHSTLLSQQLICEAKQRRRQAERQWWKLGLLIHIELFVEWREEVINLKKLVQNISISTPWNQWTGSMQRFFWTSPALYLAEMLLHLYHLKIHHRNWPVCLMIFLVQKI